MFRFETIALVVLTLAPVMGHAVGCFESRELSMRKLNDFQATTALSNAEYAARKARIDATYNDCGQRETAELGDCAKADTEFKEAISKMQNACKSENMPSSSQTGAIACSYNLDQCQCLTKGLRPWESSYLKCNTIDRTSLKFCPQLEQAQQERLDKLAKELEDRKEKLMSKAEQAAKDQQNDEKEAARDKKQARKDKAAAQEKYNQAEAQAMADANQKAKSRTEALYAAQKEVNEATDKMRDADLKDADAVRRLEDQKVTIEITCLQQAVTAVNLLQSEAVANFQKGALNFGSQTDYFAHVGLTNRQFWQQRVEERKRWCMQDPSTPAAQEKANRELAITQKSNNVQRQSAKDNADAARQQMATISGGCSVRGPGGATVQSQACMDQADTQKALDTAGKTRDSAMEEAKQDIKDADDNLAASKNARLLQLASTQAEVGGIERSLQNLGDSMKAQNGFENAGGPTAQDQARELATAQTRVSLAADRINRCCDRHSDRVNSSTCTQAKGYLSSHGITVENAPSGTNRQPSPPLPARDGDDPGTGA